MASTEEVSLSTRMRIIRKVEGVLGDLTLPVERHDLKEELIHVAAVIIRAIERMEDG